MKPIVWVYIGYLLVTLPLVVWVARTLHRNGRVFLVDAVQGNGPLADSLNHLLVVGFYLLNIGYVCFALRSNEQPADLAGILELLSAKVGFVLLVLGVVHFFNLFIFSKMRRRGMMDRAIQPPVFPQGRVEMPQ